MTDHINQAMEDVWQWKAQTEQETQGKSVPELLEYYQRKSNELSKRFGLKLNKMAADQAHDTPKS